MFFIYFYKIVKLKIYLCKKKKGDNLYRNVIQIYLLVTEILKYSISIKKWQTPTTIKIRI